MNISRSIHVFVNVVEVYGFFLKDLTEQLLHISLMLYTYAVLNYC